MKIHKRKQYSKVEGFEEEYQFRFNADAKAFKLVIENLYQDPILAIIRELSANAWDSHVEAGNTQKPFDVKLPNWSDNTFYIRDYGTGIAPEKMKEVYTVVFKSDKTESNDVTGCFGLGSKTPFAYASNFVLESWIDGKYYIYNAYLNEQDIPSLAVLDNSGTASNEPSGFKITISTKGNDYNLWSTAAKKIYPYFELMPNVKGQNLGLSKATSKLKGKDWRVYNGYGHAQVCMGNILYPISSSQIGHRFASHPIHIDLPIGSVEVTSGRDALHYDNRTVKAINDKLQEVEDELTKKINDELKGARNLYDMRMKYVTTTFKTSQDIIDLVTGSLKFGNQILWPDWGRQVKIHHLMCPVKTFNYNKNVQGREEYSITFSHNLQLFIKGKDDRHGIKKIKIYYDDHPDIKPYILYPDNDTELQDIFDVLGCDKDDVIFTEDLPDPPKQPRQPRASVAGFLKYTGRGHYLTHAWQSVSIDYNKEGGDYVIVEKNRWRKDGQLKHTSELQRLRTDLNGVINLDDIYGVKPSFLKKISKSKLWTPMEETVKDGLDTLSKEFNWGQIIHDADNFFDNLTEKDMIWLMQNVDPKCEFAKYKDRMNEVLKARKKYSLHSIYSALTKYGYTYTVKEDNPYDKYLLFPNSFYDLGADMKRHLVNYLNTI